MKHLNAAVDAVSVAIGVSSTSAANSPDSPDQDVSTADKESLNETIDPGKFKEVVQNFQSMVKSGMARLPVLLAKSSQLLELPEDAAVLKAKSTVAEVRKALAKIRKDLETNTKAGIGIEAVVQARHPDLDPAAPTASAPRPPTALHPALTASAPLTVAKLAKKSLKLKETCRKLDIGVGRMMDEIVMMDDNLTGFVAVMQSTNDTLSEQLQLISQAKDDVEQQAKPKFENALRTLSGSQRE